LVPGESEIVGVAARGNSARGKSRRRLIPGTDYTQTAVRLGPGDLVILYTDGVSEAVNEEEQELGYEGLLGLARTLPTETPKLIGPALLEAVQRFRGTARAFDDRSILILQQADESHS